ncbi:MAG: serine hydrolase domain-containing protein [Gemmatimonadota bacterium]|jgi:D-alanyl-D-alanine carboxypeptidase
MSKLATRRRTACLIALAATGLGASSCTLDITAPAVAAPESWDPARNTHPDSVAFQTLLDRYVHEGLPGLVLLVRAPEGAWNGAAGYANLERAEPMQPTHLFHAASVTKTYAATAALLTAEDGLIDLDATISTYLPPALYRRIPNGASATVRQLLGHRSGIPDFSGDLRYDLDFLNDPLGSYPPERMLSYLEGQSALSAPGGGYFYANANYYILALLLDRAVQGGHAAFISRRILAPLGLGATYYRAQPEYPTPPGLVSSYQDLAGDGRLMNVTDLTTHNDQVFMGNAGLIAASEDFADFLDGLLQGTLLAPASLSAMESWSEPAHYGLGLSYRDTPYGRALGHSGGDMGALAQVRYFPDHDVTLVLLCNAGNDGVPDTLFGRLWDDVMDAALGPGAPSAPR